MTAQAWFEWGIPIAALAIGVFGFLAIALRSRMLDKVSSQSSRDRENAQRLAKF